MHLLAFRPFLDVPPIADYWVVLMLPLCLAVSVVYKSMKCRYMSQVPWEASVIFVWIIGGFAATAAALMLLVNWLGR
jgi:hypothetical protein